MRNNANTNRSPHVSERLLAPSLSSGVQIVKLGGFHRGTSCGKHHRPRRYLIKYRGRSEEPS